MRKLVIALPFTLLLLLAGPGFGQEPATPHGQIQLWDQALTRLENILTETETILPGDSIDYQASLTALIANARRLREAEGARLPQLRSQLESLGLPPAEGEPPEDKDVSKKRRQITNEVALAEGRIKQSDLAIARASALLAEIGRKEQAEIQQQILIQGPPAGVMETWSLAFAQDIGSVRDLGQVVDAWWTDLTKRDIGQLRLLVPPLVLIAIIVVSFFVRRIILRRWGPSGAIANPTYARRIAAASASTIARILLPALAVGATLSLFFLSLPDANAARLRSLALDLGGHALWFLAVTGLAMSALSPNLPAWRILPVPEDATAALARRIVLGSALILTVEICLTLLINPATGLPGQHVRSLGALLNALIAAIVLMPVLRSSNWAVRADGFLLFLARLLRLGAALTIVSALAAAFLGYANLSRHLLGNLAVTAAVVVLVYMSRALIGEALRALLAPEGRYFASVASATGITPEAGRRLIFWARLLSEFIIWPPAIYLLLVAYGLSPSLLQAWSGQVIGGVAIGSLTISPIDLGAALITVILGFLAVGAIKRWMRERVMPNTGLDRGLQNSIATGVGYLGGIAVLMLGVAALGIDLGNLALVAGALSVGMGFGLKTIVENFVAGILLLIERPVKAGDWIVVGSTEGIVKSISVRSTEIETFDRSSVIVPNSELIASPVINWTHKNRIARVMVKVAIATGNDPKQAEQIMIQCAASHPRVMRHPAPSVVFRAMAATLQLELRCFITDTDYYLPVLSDLNFAIFEAFRAEGIKLPA